MESNHFWRDNNFIKQSNELDWKINNMNIEQDNLKSDFASTTFFDISRLQMRTAHAATPVFSTLLFDLSPVKLHNGSIWVCPEMWHNRKPFIARCVVQVLVGKQDG